MYTPNVTTNVRPTCRRISYNQRLESEVYNRARQAQGRCPIMIHDVRESVRDQLVVAVVKDVVANPTCELAES